GGARRTVIAPGEGRIDHGSQGRESRIVALVERQVGRRIPDRIAEQLVAPAQIAANRLGVRVENDLVGIEAMSFFGFVGPMDAVAVELFRMDVGQISVLDLVGVLGYGNAL